MSEEKAKKLYSISEAASVTGVAPHVLRYWEKEFSFLRPLRDTRGHRLYRRSDLEKIKKIKNALYTEGYRIRGVKKRFRTVASSQHTLLRKRKAFLKSVIRELREIERWLS